MAQVYSKLEIDVNERVTNIITAVQKDSGSRFLDVVLLDGSSPIDLTGHEVRIYGKKYDGKEFYNNGEITDALHGRCQFELTAQALAVANHLEVQIVLFKDNVEILSTQAFKILVVKSLLSDSAIESSNEYGALVVLFQNLYEAYDLMVDMVKNMGNAGEIATGRDADTFWKMLEYMAKYMDNDLTQLLENALKNSSVQGVLDRIGTSTDTNKDTLFGKLSKSGVKFYIPSQTEGYIYTAEELANVNQAALSWVGISALGHFVLGRIQAKHSGTIRIRTTVSAATSQSIRLLQIFDTPTEAKISAPTGSGMTTQSDTYKLGALFTSTNLTSSVATTMDLALNVQEGSTYTVVLTAHYPTMVNLIEFGFYYETVDKDELEEFSTRKIIS